MPLAEHFSERRYDARRLFTATCVSLAVIGLTFSIRGDLIGAFECNGKAQRLFSDAKTREHAVQHCFGRTLTGKFAQRGRRMPIERDGA